MHLSVLRSRLGSVLLSLATVQNRLLNFILHKPSFINKPRLTENEFAITDDVYTAIFLFLSLYDPKYHLSQYFYRDIFFSFMVIFPNLVILLLIRIHSLSGAEIYIFSLYVDKHD